VLADAFQPATLDICYVLQASLGQMNNVNTSPLSQWAGGTSMLKPLSRHSAVQGSAHSSFKVIMLQKHADDTAAEGCRKLSSMAQ